MIKLTEEIMLTMILKTSNTVEMEWVRDGFNDGRFYFEETPEPVPPSFKGYYDIVFDDMNILYRMAINDNLAYVYFIEDSYFLEIMK